MLKIGVSSRSLFDLEKEDIIFKTQGVEAYANYQKSNEDVLLEKGSAYYLLESLLELNKFQEETVEVIVMSRNTPDLGLRISKSIEHYELPIEKAIYTGGQPLAEYLHNLEIDLFLSRDGKDVIKAIEDNVAAGCLQDLPNNFNPDDYTIRVAFDADAVLFSDKSQKIFDDKGLDKYLEHEFENIDNPMEKGPFAKFLIKLAEIQRLMDKYSVMGASSLRIAIVTARDMHTFERVVHTLRHWGVKVDEAACMAGQDKNSFLGSFQPHIFFDDNLNNVERAACIVPTAHVKYN